MDQIDRMGTIASQTAHNTHGTIVPILLVICGPTATGKTGLAIAIAQRLAPDHPVAILSADSRQIYREFDIGTAKPSLWEQKQAPHYLIDIADPTTTLTLADYQEQAQRWIATFHQATQPVIPLLVGGTGLYIRSVVKGLKIPRVPPHSALRSQLQQLGQPLCYAFLERVDPVSADRIHPNDQVRTLRALEVFYTTGAPMSNQQGENPPSYPILQIGLDCFQPEALAHRIEQRTQQMMTSGFVAEVERLMYRYGTDLPLLQTLGYQEILQYLQGNLSLEEAERLTAQHTRQFAKRQRTWFRADSSIEWFDADAPDLVNQVWQRIQQFRAEVATTLVVCS